MLCPYGQGATQERARRPVLGYRLFRCRPGRRPCTEPTGPRFHRSQEPTDVALLVVLGRLRSTPRLRALAELVLARLHRHAGDRAGVGGTLF